ncbi:hypothetical protein JW707_05110 [Candidatus Woesearchaeota archaeon]|nr:hypothetical protein [Candidatus Woesearchaeota archaeon]
MASVYSRIPVFKKKISSFLAKEDGKISKENLIKAGILAAILSAGAAASAKQVSASVSCDPSCSGNPDPPNELNVDKDLDPIHYNFLRLGKSGGAFQGTHEHCIESCHVSHSSHGSHGSHGSHNSTGW